MKCWQKVFAVVSFLLLPLALLAQQGEQRQAIEAAKRVLSDDEFTDATEPSFLENLFVRFIEWLQELFSSAELGPLSGLGQILGPILLAVLIAALLILIALLVSRFQWARRPEPFANYCEDRKAPPHELLRLSDEAASKGDFSRAFTLAYWAFLKLADTADQLDYLDEATNWEILSTLRPGANAALSSEARRLARTFDEIEYGDSRADAEDVASVKRLIGILPEVKAAA